MRTVSTMAVALMLGGAIYAMPASAAPELPLLATIVKARLNQAEHSLTLTSSQKALWDTAVSATEQAIAHIKYNNDQLRDVARSELAKPRPDLALLGEMVDATQAANIAERQKARGYWLAVYAALDDAQVEQAKTLIQDRLERLEALRALILSRLGR